MRLPLALLPLAIVAGLGTAAAPAGAKVTATSGQAAEFANVVVLNRYEKLPTLKYNTDGTTVAWPPTLPTDTAVIHVTNQSSGSVSVTGADVGNAAFKVTAPTSFPISLGGGDSLDVTVKFVGGNPGGGKTTNLVKDALTVHTTDAETPNPAVSLRGFWAAQPEHGNEPSLKAIVSDFFGFGTVIVKPGQTLKNNGHTEAVGDEILSPYWKKLDTTKPVKLTELAAFHGTGKAESIAWNPRGAKTPLKRILIHDADYAQAFLPPLDPAANIGTGPAVKTFEPSAQFGLYVSGEYTDGSFNNTKVDMDETHGCVTQCGHHFRAWPAKDQSGNPIPGAYIMAMDYGSSPSVNYDFQDNVYLMENAQPADPVAFADTPLNPTDPGRLIARIDAGSKTGSTDQYGRTWAPDTGLFTPTTLPDEGSASASIAGTPDANDAMFGTYRGQTPNDVHFKIPVGTSRKVSVRLYFAERYWTSPGKRVFDVFAGTTQIADNLDIFAQSGGRDVAYTLTADNIALTSDTLDLRLKSSVNYPSIAGIEVFNSDGSSVPTPTPATPTPGPGATPAPTPTPGPGATPVPTPVSTPVSTPAPGGTPAPATPTPAPPATPAPTPTPAPGGDKPKLSISVKQKGSRTLQEICSLSFPVTGAICRIDVTLGKTGKGTRLLLKREKIQSGRSQTTLLKFTSAQWTKMKASGVTVQVTVLAADGKQILATGSVFRRVSGS